jgi:hypothetical protein
MRGQEHQGEYDFIMSLGSNCQAAYQLKRLKLRAAAGPMDWFISQAAHGVARLIENRYQGMMEVANLERMHPLQTCYCVKDKAYSIYSYHDFPLALPPERWLEAYPVFKESNSRRVERIVRLMEQPSKRLLFVRVQSSKEDAKLIRDALAARVEGSFVLLIVNQLVQDSPPEVTEELWELPQVRAFRIPPGKDWRGNDAAWEQVLHGVVLRS